MGKNLSSQNGRIQFGTKWNISIDDETKENRDKIFRHCFEWYAEQLKGELGWNYPPLSTPNVTRNNIPAKQRDTTVRFGSKWTQVRLTDNDNK